MAKVERAKVAIVVITCLNYTRCGHETRPYGRLCHVIKLMKWLWCSKETCVRCTAALVSVEARLAVCIGRAAVCCTYTVAQVLGRGAWQEARAKASNMQGYPGSRMLVMGRNRPESAHMRSSRRC